MSATFWPTERLGDPLPESLAAFYRALDDARFGAAAAAFSEDAVYAAPPQGDSEVDPRSVAVGRSAIADLLAGRGPRSHRHRVVVGVGDASSFLVEGVLESPQRGVFRSFVVTLQLDSQGLMTRYLAFACEPAIDTAPSTAEGTPGDAGAVVDRYYANLDTAEFEAAAACFSENVVYCHPPYRHGGLKGSGRVYFRGRDELLAGFRARGQTSSRHVVPVSFQHGPNCLFETQVPGRGSAVSTLSLDPQGLIQRYVAFYCEPAIERR